MIPRWLARFLCFMDGHILPPRDMPPVCLRCKRRLWLV